MIPFFYLLVFKRSEKFDDSLMLTKAYCNRQLKIYHQASEQGQSLGGHLGNTLKAILLVYPTDMCMCLQSHIYKDIPCNITCSSQKVRNKVCPYIRDKLWFSCTVEYYTAVKNNEAALHVSSKYFILPLIYFVKGSL